MHAVVRQITLFWRFVLRVYRGFVRHQGFDIAKSLTFTSLFAVVPLLTLMLMLFSTVPLFRIYGDSVASRLLDHLLPRSGLELRDYLEAFAGQARNLTWIGVVMLAVTSVLMLREIESSFNRIWGVPQMRRGVIPLLVYWAVVSLGPLLLGVGLVINSFLTSLALFARFAALSDVFGVRSLALDLFPTLLTTGAFTLLYLLVPNCPVRLRDALTGAVAVVLALKGVQWAFTLSITTAGYQLVYGTFAALPICLLWLYACWVVILAGANLVQNLPLYGKV